MQSTKRLSLVGGIIAAVIGVFVLLSPSSIFRIVIWIVAVSIIALCGGGMIRAIKRSMIGIPSIFSIISNGVMLVFGLTLLFSGGARGTFSNTVGLILGIGMIIIGALQILNGVEMKRGAVAKNDPNVIYDKPIADEDKKNFIFPVVIGVALIGFGIAGVVAPSFLPRIIGYAFGVILLALGVYMIIFAFKKAEQ